jgi:hypothetical protein
MAEIFQKCQNCEHIKMYPSNGIEAAIRVYSNYDRLHCNECSKIKSLKTCVYPFYKSKKIRPIGYLKKHFPKSLMLTSIFLLFSNIGLGQKIVYEYLNKNDTVTNVIKIWKGKVNTNLVILLPPYGGNFDYYNSSKLPKLLTTKGIDFAVAYPGDVGYLEESHLAKLDSLIGLAVNKYGYNPKNIIIGGFSAGGYGAMKYTVNSKMENTKLHYFPKAVFSVDAPLDIERWYYSLKSITERNPKDNKAYGEAFYITGMLKDLFGGDPSEKPELYEMNSVVTIKKQDGGNVKYLKSTPILLFTEPDINWYIDNMNLDYTQINAIDQAAIINILKLQGNKNAELVVTSGKGFRPDLGNIRMPHSWQIVDEIFLSNWIIRQLK